jgi:PAS domain S-box-containing protein
MKVLFLIFSLGNLIFSQDIKYFEDQIPNSPGPKKIEYLLKIGAHYLKKNPAKSLTAAKDALKYSLNLNSDAQTGQCYLLMGKINYILGNNQTSEGYLNKALHYFYKTGDKKNAGDCLSQLSVVKRVLGDFDESLDYALQSLKNHSAINDSAGIAENFNELGLIYRNLGEIEKSIAYHYDAQRIAASVNNKCQERKSLNYIGNYYFFRGDIDKAEDLYKKSLKVIPEKDPEDDFYAGIINNLGNCKRENKDYSSAMALYSRSLEVCRKIGDKNLLTVIYKNIGITKRYEKNFEASLKYLTAADSLAEITGIKRFNSDIALEISKLYASWGHFEKALEFHKKYSELNDSIFHIDMANKVRFYEQKYEEHKVKEAISETKLSQEIIFRNLLIIILLIALIFLVLVYHFYRKNQRSTRQIKKQREELINLNAVLEDKNNQLEEFEDFVNRTKAIIVVWKSGEEQTVKFISKNIQSQLGFSSAEFISGRLKWGALIHPDDRERISAEQEVFRANKVFEYSQHYRLMNSGGDYRWFEGHSKTLIDRNTNESIRQAVVLDIHERRMLEQKLLEHTEELHELNIIKDKFFSIVAHDLKSPFLGLLGLSNMINERFSEIDNEQKAEYLSAMNQMIKRVYKLIENLLDWSRMQLNKFEVNLAPVNIKTVCDGIIEVLDINASEKNISVFNSIPENLVIETDEKIISTMFSNLISNAIKFTNETGVIKIYSAVKNNFVFITVEDNGVGIPAECIEDIFKIDKKLSTIGTAGEKGTGLGLTITKEMAGKLGGDIFAVSEPDKYTKFTFSLPATKG